MKQSLRKKRTAALMMALLIILHIIPLDAEDELIASGWTAVYSDSYRVPLTDERVTLTEENARINATLFRDGAIIEEDSTLEAAETLDALFAISMADGGFVAGTTYVYALPEAMLVADSEWTAVDGYLWRVRDGALEIADTMDEGELVEVKVYLSFTLRTGSIDVDTEHEDEDEADDAEETNAVTIADKRYLLRDNEQNEDNIEETDETLRVLNAEGEDYAIRVYVPEAANIPENAELVAEEVLDSETYAEQIREKLQVSEDEITDLRLFDLSLVADGETYEPEVPLRVEMRLAVAGEEIHALHFAAPAPAQQPLAALGRMGVRRVQSAEVQPTIEEMDTAAEGGIIAFEASSFSIYALVGITLEKRVLASDGNTYLIQVTYGADAGLPEDAELEAYEILKQTVVSEDSESEYDQYLAEAEQALGYEAGTVSYARFFEISIVNAAGETLQPAEGATVQVSIRLDDAEAYSDLQVVHFGEETEVLLAQTEDDTVRFEAESFSVYAVVDAPEPYKVEIRPVTSLNEITEGTAYYLSYGSSIYFTSSLNANGCLIENSVVSSAAEWYFERVGDAYRLYTYINREKKYLIRTDNENKIGFGSENGMALTIYDSPTAGKFLFKLETDNRWLQHSNGGGGIRFYTDASNATNSRIAITTSNTTMPDDPYGLDGKTFGIAYNDYSAKAVGLTINGTTVSGTKRLKGQDMVIRPNVLELEGILLVAQSTDLPFWTFHKDHENFYKISTIVDGQEKYLQLDGENLFLTDNTDEASLVAATPGTGSYSGKWNFSANGCSINYTGTVNNGFKGGTTNVETNWLNLVEKSPILTDDDFNYYAVKKVSVSDPANVWDGQQVVLYTRVWNDKIKRYEFYVVDHDGRLILAYDTGDGIEWIGTAVNTTLWNFTEYTYADGTPNYYYELENTQYHNYIAPQLTGNQILSSGTIGINLNGRRYGDNYTTIIAWDDTNYAYTGLKVEDGRLVACPLNEAEDFYFAVMQPADPNDQLTTVTTLDNNTYGITMKMIDFNNELLGTLTDKNRDSVQTAFFGGSDNNVAGLLSTDLKGNGYPDTTSKTGHVDSLADLFSEAELKNVNHLFLQSIYHESGYFEYDSTQNFAHLLENGNFVVYDQIGQVSKDVAGNIGDDGSTRTHGQFMPYNDLVPGRYSTVTNKTNVTAEELSDLDPRKYEKLYMIPLREADYFFGMEVSASFTQTASGLDAWGHDIIFEFSGDDDFWLYVDGELVLDLGGVHPAMTGSVNFRTGEIKSSRGNSTLYNVFKKNYQSRGMSAAEINEKLNEIFVRNADGQYVFKDFTDHEMKIFYMERGSGASNLHMRFNLAAVNPGTFVLSKTLSGAESTSNSLIEFPYQIWYKTKEDGEREYHLLSNELIGNNTNPVVYNGTSNPVPYVTSYKPAGGTVSYSNVYFLKAGESAEVTLPENATTYYVVECGLNPDIYDQVTVNGSKIAGKNTDNMVGSTPRQDYQTEPAELELRSRVAFNNEVKKDAMRTLEITKKLYDVNGITPLNYPNNKTEFSFRLYLGNEDATDLTLANMYDYCVKDGDGFYCTWDAGKQCFVSLGKRNYSDLSDDEKKAATFTSSMNGSISHIPPDHTVEVRDLIIGTKYMVEERDYEIPRGYTLRSSDGYTRVDGDNYHENRDTPYSGTIMAGEDPKIEVRNQKGWGMTVKKVWTDADFMEAHDDIYFAVYVKTGENDYELDEEHIYRYTAGMADLYIFFDDLYFNNKLYPFSAYYIFEVELTGETVEETTGRVTNFTRCTRIAPDSELQTLKVDGKPYGSEEQSFTYTVSYEIGKATDKNENVRTDTVTNSRLGLPLYKTLMNGDAFEGAVFTLTTDEGENVSKPTFQSGEDGLITIAYLAPGTYTLKETEVPNGYTALDQPIKITIPNSENGDISISPSDDVCCVVNREGEKAIAITVKNRTADFQVKKIDAEYSTPLKGVHFALYREVTSVDGTRRKDYYPLANYTDLVTDEDGIVPEVNFNLPADTYYLTETETVEQYEKLTKDIRFTIGKDGKVTVDENEWVTLYTTNTRDHVSYQLVVKNGFIPKPTNVTITGIKIMSGRNMNEGEFEFTLTPIDINGERIDTPMNTVSNSAADGDESHFEFAPISYDLYEYTNATYHDEQGNALFYYLVQESVPDGATDNYKNGIRYSTDKYLVVVTVSYEPEERLLTARWSAYNYDGDGVPQNLRPKTETVALA